ncbi:hypothetical protein DFH11DRAFT_1628996 [Phellopilus nigrolimitatus]|nr:hypothetical protein DFH11DRAFT_1628996 [Phellopilus nigrolimitatus]
MTRRRTPPCTPHRAFGPEALEPHGRDAAPACTPGLVGLWDIAVSSVDEVTNPGRSAHGAEEPHGTGDGHGVRRGRRTAARPCGDHCNPTTPSYVSFDQERLIGDAAKNQMAMNPVNTVFDAKRLIGRSSTTQLCRRRSPKSSRHSTLSALSAASSRIRRFRPT